MVQHKGPAREDEGGYFCSTCGRDVLSDSPCERPVSLSVLDETIISATVADAVMSLAEDKFTFDRGKASDVCLKYKRWLAETAQRRRLESLYSRA